MKVTVWKLKAIAFLLLISISVTGCVSNDPFWKDTDFKPSLVDISQEQKDKLSYLGRFVLDADERNKLSNRIINNLSATNNSPNGISNSGMNTSAGMAAAQTLNGSVFSKPGMNTAATVSLALDALSLFIPDGSLDISSALYFPESFENQSLDTPEQAQKAAWMYVDKRVKASAEAVGRIAECTLHCNDEHHRVYLLTLSSNINSNYNYNPKYIAMDFWFGDEGMKPYKTDNLEVWALGFTPKWHSGNGRLAFPLFREVLLDKDNNPLMAKDGEYTYKYYRLQRVPFGRELFRHFYDDSGYGFLISRENTNGRHLYFKGKTYFFNDYNSKNFIQSESIEIEPPQLTSNSVK